MRFLGLIVVFSLAGCVNTQREEMMRDDIFKVQTRLLKVEHRLDSDTTDAKSKEETTSKSIASTSVSLDKLKTDIESVRGEVDALKIGVKTGELPGSPTGEDSLAKQILDIRTRLLALEETQAEMLKTLSKQKPSEGKKPGLSSIDSFRSAFNNKKYKEVVEEAPAKLKSLSGKSQQELKFIYAESLFKLGRHSDSALTYNELIKDNMLPDRMAFIYLRMGDAFRQLKDKDAATVYYKELIEKFPKSGEEVEKARKQLEQLAQKKKGSGGAAAER